MQCDNQTPLPWDNYSAVLYYPNAPYSGPYVTKYVPKGIPQWPQITWEGSPQQLCDPSRPWGNNCVTTNLQSGAIKFGVNSYVGTISTPIGEFNCFKGGDIVVYTEPYNYDTVNDPSVAYNAYYYCKQ